MVWIVGIASNEEVEELRARGYTVESAERYNLVGELHHHLLENPPEGTNTVAIWVDSDLMTVFNGPTWDQAGMSKEARDFVKETLGEYDWQDGNEARRDKFLSWLDNEVLISTVAEASDLLNTNSQVMFEYLIRTLGLTAVKRMLEEAFKDSTVE